MSGTTLVASTLVVVTLLFGSIAIATQPQPSTGIYAYVLGWIAYSLLGGLLAALRPRNPIGWLFGVMGLSSELGLAAESMRSTYTGGPGLAVEGALTLFAGFWFVAFQLIAALLVLFPTGRPLSRRWWFVLALIVPNTLFGTLASGDPPASAAISAVLTAAFGPETGPAIAKELQGSTSVLLMALLAAGALALVTRMRRSDGVERQQLKWIAFAGVLVVVTFVSTTVAFFWAPLRAFDPSAPFPAAMFGGIPMVAALIAVPGAAAIAILRYRLYDIDLLINRTVVYGATSAAIALTFFAGILALQALLRPLTAESELAVAASTLVSFALFQPIRRRIQDAVDRRFDRARYDAARTLEAFADHLRDEVDLDALRDDLLGAVERTMAPAHAGVWLRGALGRP